MPYVLIPVLALPPTAHQGNQSNTKRNIPDEQRLLNKVFRVYDNSVRPVYNATSNVVVNFGLTLIQILDMVSFSFKPY